MPYPVMYFGAWPPQPNPGNQNTTTKERDMEEEGQDRQQAGELNKQRWGGEWRTKQAGRLSVAAGLKWAH